MSDERRDEPNNATSYREQVMQRKRAAEENRSPSEEDSRRPLPSPFIDEIVWAKELGLGMGFAARNKDRFCFSKNTGTWLEFDGNCWKDDRMHNAYRACEDLAGCIREEAQKLSDRIGQAASDGDEHERQRLEAIRKQYDKQIDQLRTQRGRTNTLIMAHTCDGGLGITGDELDANPWLLGVANGVIDTRTGQLRKGRREDYITLASPVEWKGIEEPADTWQQVLYEIFGENQELTDFVQRALGYALLGRHLEDKFFVLSGQGRNGKSLLVETVRWILGPLAGPIPAELLIDQGKSRNSSGPSPDIMLLKGLRMAIATETDQGQRISPSQVKWLSGGDTLVGRNPHDRHLTSFEPTHTLFLLTNHRPHAPADDFAFWERVLLIPFEMSFVDREPEADNERRQDKNLKHKLREEASGILAWLVRGCLEYQQQGLNPPDIVKNATSNYRREEDTLQDWIEEECIVLDTPNHGSTPAAQLYERFAEWWKSKQGAKVPSGTWFGRNMARKFHRAKKSGVNHYFGVRLA